MTSYTSEDSSSDDGPRLSPRLTGYKKTPAWKRGMNKLQASRAKKAEKKRAEEARERRRLQQAAASPQTASSPTSPETQASIPESVGSSGTQSPPTSPDTQTSNSLSYMSTASQTKQHTGTTSSGRAPGQHVDAVAASVVDKEIKATPNPEGLKRKREDNADNRDNGTILKKPKVNHIEAPPPTDFFAKLNNPFVSKTPNQGRVTADAPEGIKSAMQTHKDLGETNKPKMQPPNVHPQSSVKKDASREKAGGPKHIVDGASENQQTNRERSTAQPTPTSSTFQKYANKNDNNDKKTNTGDRGTSQTTTSNAGRAKASTYPGTAHSTGSGTQRASQVQSKATGPAIPAPSSQKRRRDADSTVDAASQKQKLVVNDTGTNDDKPVRSQGTLRSTDSKGARRGTITQSKGKDHNTISLAPQRKDDAIDTDNVASQKPKVTTKNAGTDKKLTNSIDGRTNETTSEGDRHNALSLSNGTISPSAISSPQKRKRDAAEDEDTVSKRQKADPTPGDGAASFTDSPLIAQDGRNAEETTPSGPSVQASDSRSILHQDIDGGHDAQGHFKYKQAPAGSKILPDGRVVLPPGTGLYPKTFVTKWGMEQFLQHQKQYEEPNLPVNKCPHCHPPMSGPGPTTKRDATQSLDKAKPTQPFRVPRITDETASLIIERYAEREAEKARNPDYSSRSGAWKFDAQGNVHRVH